MPYIGNTPAEKYASYDVQHITTSATTSYVLDKNVANENEIRVVLNNIIQQPGASYAYTASANTLTLSVATTSNDTLYVVFTGKAVQTVTPPPSSVGLAQLNATGSPGTNTFLRGDNSWATPSDTSLTLNNNAANRVVAGTGTTNTMDAQAGLIFDGSKLGIGTSTMTRTLNVTDTTASASTGIQLIGANDGTQFLNFGDTDDTNVGEINYDHSLDKMNFRTNDAYAMVIDSAGIVTKALNPAFRVYQSTQTTYANNHTMYNQNITEVYDVNSDYGTSFTAPVTGKYLFTASFYDVTASDAQTYNMMLTTSNRNYPWGNLNAFKNGYTGISPNMKGEGTIIVDMDANDTAYVTCGSSGNVDNGSNSEHSYFSGILIG